MKKKYTLRMDFKMEEPTDYEDFKWRFLRAVSTCVDDELIIQNVHLMYGCEDGLVMRGSAGEFIVPNVNSIG